MEKEKVIPLTNQAPPRRGKRRFPSKEGTEVTKKAGVYAYRNEMRLAKPVPDFRRDFGANNDGPTYKTSLTISHSSGCSEPASKPEQPKK